MKFAAAIALLASSASAFNSFAPKKAAAKAAAPVRECLVCLPVQVHHHKTLAHLCVFSR